MRTSSGLKMKPLRLLGHDVDLRRLGDLDGGRIDAAGDVLHLVCVSRDQRLAARHTSSGQQRVDLLVVVVAGVGAGRPGGVRGDQRLAHIPGVVVVGPPGIGHQVGPLAGRLVPEDRCCWNAA